MRWNGIERIVVVICLLGCDRPESKKKEANAEAAGPPARPTIKLVHAARTGNLQQVRSHLHWGCNVNEVALPAPPSTQATSQPTEDAEAGITPLMAAASQGHREIVSLLIENGADVNWKGTRMPSTALEGAASEGRVEIVKILLAKGASPALADRIGHTPLHWAALGGRADVCDALLAAGAAIDLPGSSNRTPLFLATMSRNKDTVAVLLKRGAKVNQMSTDIGAPLHESAFQGTRDIAALLLDGGADVNLRNRFGISPIEIALDENNTEVADLLKQKGANAAGYSRLNQRNFSKIGYWTKREELKKMFGTPTSTESLPAGTSNGAPLFVDKLHWQDANVHIWITFAKPGGGAEEISIKEQSGIPNVPAKIFGPGRPE